MLRTNLAHRYTDAMKDWEMITLPNSGNENVKHAWHLFAPLIDPTATIISRPTRANILARFAS